MDDCESCNSWNDHPEKEFPAPCAIQYSMEALYLPKLNRLNPTVESTVFKVVEEAGELARAVLQHIAQTSDSSAELDDVAAELLDVSQTCVTMIFVMEDMHGLRINEMVDVHLQKLRRKGYLFPDDTDYRVADVGEFKVLRLPRLQIPGVDLLKTVCKIQEEIGELTQFLGKGSAASGEACSLGEEDRLRGAALELLDIAQCCFTMMYILADQYRLDLAPYVQRHEHKLRSKGYFA